MNIAASIKKKREEFDIEQQELARRAGISKALLSAIEGGTRFPSLPMVQTAEFLIKLPSESDS